MNSPEYLNLPLHAQADFIGKIVIMAQSEEHFKMFQVYVQVAESNGLFDKVSPGDPSHPSLKDLDHPLENGPHSPQS